MSAHSLMSLEHFIIQRPYYGVTTVVQFMTISRKCKFINGSGDLKNMINNYINAKMSSFENT